MRRLTLIRHGQTAGNLLNKYVGGRTDEPLCSDGIERASAPHGFGDIRRVYVSPMLRAEATARIMFPNAELITCEGLREMDFGAFEGRSADEMENDGDYRAWVDGMCREKCPDGESIYEFSDRVICAFDEIMGRGEDEVTIVSHGGTIMAIMAKYADPPKDYHEWSVKNCGGFSASFDNGRIFDYKRF